MTSSCNCFTGIINKLCGKSAAELQAEEKQRELAVAQEQAKIAFNNKQFLQAVRDNSFSESFRMLNRGVNKNVRDPETGETALMIATSLDYRGLAEHLLLAGSDPAARDVYDRSVLFWSISKGNKALTCMLLRRNTLQGNPGIWDLGNSIFGEKEFEKMMRDNCNMPLEIKGRTEIEAEQERHRRKFMASLDSP